MSKKIKKVIIATFIIIIAIVAIISTFFIIKYFHTKSQINTVYEIYSENNVQDKLNNDDNENLLLQINDESVVGVIKIDRIKFEGLIYEGTTLKTLDKGVGHFESSSYFDGNVCLAAHNSNKFWSKLHILQNGDKITYTSFLGTRNYEVQNIKKISSTDWSLLENTIENTLTLITCVKGVPSQRLCVQALAID